MSIINKLLDSKNKLNTPLLIKVLDTYTECIESGKKDLELRGKSIEDALVCQHSLAAYYDERRIELYTIKEIITQLMDVRAADINLAFKEGSTYDHSDRSVALLIKGDSKYVEYRKLEIEVAELAHKISSICNQFERRGYTLTNIRSILEAGLRDVILTSDDE